MKKIFTSLFISAILLASTSVIAQDNTKKEDAGKAKTECPNKKDAKACDKKEEGKACCEADKKDAKACDKKEGKACCEADKKATASTETKSCGKK